MSTEAPEIPLAHYLKTLKLPTFQREYQKLGSGNAAEGVDHIGYLTRLAEREMIERDRRKVERRIKAAKFRSSKVSTASTLPPSRSSTRCRCWNWRVANGSSGARMSSRSVPAARARPMSPSGTGLAACQRGLAVGFTTAAALVSEDDGGARRAAAVTLPEADGRLQASSSTSWASCRSRRPARNCCSS